MINRLETKAASIAMYELLAERDLVTNPNTDGAKILDRLASDARREFDELAAEVGATPEQIQAALEHGKKFKAFAQMRDREIATTN